MRITNTIVFTIVMGFLISCYQKDKSANKIKTVVNHHTGTYEVYNYDAHGRIESLEDKQYKYIDHYNYFDDSIVDTKAGTDGKVIYILSAKIDTHGYIISYPGVSRTYDDSGFLIKMEYPGTTDSDSVIYTIGKGDIISERVLRKDTILTATTYSYYDIIDSRNCGMSFWGKKSAHLIKTATTKSALRIDVTYYNYTFDGRKRVITETISLKGDKGKSTVAYTYTD